MDVFATGPDMWIGKVGHFLILLAFFSALLAAVSYWLSAANLNNQKEFSWKAIGRNSFIVHCVSVLGVVSLVFYMMAAKKYAYSYVYQHASNDLPFRYLFAAFWEGQEGSTMLWAFWHVILSLIFLRKAKQWEAPVLGTVAMVQVFLVSMLLGIYFFGHRVGVNPFYLLKSSASNAPIFAANPNFVPKDGAGLNELLRNYWMVIHPPTVFLGFASITFPFGFALGALFWRKLRDWITPALPWALLAGGVLGIGVLMGGAWAYEALSFGGFWVWDPVENASLVPWLLIVSAIHLMLVYRSTGHSGLATFLLVILSFILVAYSTFLTKSGVLGEASVHSFTDLGMSGLLVVFILFFWFVSFLLLQSSKQMKLVYAIGSALLLAAYFIIGQTGYILIGFLLFSVLLLFATNHFKTNQEEEKLWSREFWLFIGSVVLLLSALHISLATSVPVYNKLFGTEYAIFAEQHFNAVQVWPAILMVLLSAFVLYLNYNKQSKINFAKQLGWPLVAALAVTILIVYIYKFSNGAYILLLLASFFTVFANANYMFTVFKGKLNVSGPTIAHLGFGILLAGIVVSQSKKTIISKNTKANVNVSEENTDLNENNILLYENEPVNMQDYVVTLKEDDVEGKLRDGVIIDFKKLDENGEFIKEFKLIPKYKEMDESLIADPAIKRGLTKDFFTHISLLNLGANIDTTKYEPLTFNSKADTVVYDRMIFVLDQLKQGTDREDIDLQANDIAVAANMRVITKDSMYNVEPVYLIRDNQAGLVPAELPNEKIALRIEEIKPESDEVVIGIKSSRPFKKYILLKAMIFPLINLVWLGSILMFIGFMISMVNRLQQAKRRLE